MKPTLSPKIVFRVPKFSWKSTLISCWEALKLDISLASPAFYELIKDVDFGGIEKLSIKEQFTIWKYFNRARFRATPFGTFGAFGIAELESAPAVPLQLKGDFKQHRFVNWPKKNEIASTPNEILLKDPYLVVNSSFYLTGTDSIRFISVSDKQFELAEVDSDEMVLRILALTQQKIKKTAVLTALDLPLKDVLEVESLLEDMLSVQLLLSEYEPNIIGQDYFERLGVGYIEDRTPYVICEADSPGAKISDTHFRHLPALIDVLHRNTAVRPNQTLENFKTRFLKKFDQNEVPLMLALDPEMGVGYDELEQSGSSSAFAAALKFKVRSQDNSNQNFFREQLSEFFSSSTVMHKEIDLEKLFPTQREAAAMLPNSLSVILQIVGEQIYLEQIGGATANALSGRFTLGSKEMLSLSKENARHEEMANPEVIFFDVAYMGEANVDNINRRASIYDAQLSILNYDMSANPLSLSDVFISVQRGEIVLRSKVLKKRLVPRIATAYNYSRSDLSLFRLLCDLQHQNIHSYLLPDIEKLFPEQQVYPRISYRNIIVSPQKWKIKTNEIPKKPAQLKVFFEKKGVSNVFRCGQSDQLLCFDRGNEEDISAFIQYIAKTETILLEEFFDFSSAAIVDADSQPLISQFILNAQHTASVYRPINTEKNDKSAVDVQSHFLPGSEWIYYEVYCHQQRSNDLLFGPISNVLSVTAELVDKWFFIRYDENGDHLRFRFKLKDKLYFQQVASIMQSSMADWMQCGLISDVQIKTYQRELVRYGFDLIDEVEKHFYIDSQLVLSEILTLTVDFEKYMYAVDLAKRVLNKVFDRDTVLKLVREVSNSFEREHQLEAAEFKDLNKNYAEYLTFRSHNTTEINSLIFENSFIELLNQSESRKIQLFTDLFHMHVNRMFHDLQRTHEMIIYYFLYKDLQRERALMR